MDDLQSIGKAGAAAHEKFVREMREIDVAHFRGKLHEWVQEKLDHEHERIAAGFDSDG
jgi:hypothetical protein